MMSLLFSNATTELTAIAELSTPNGIHGA